MENDSYDSFPDNALKGITNIGQLLGKSVDWTAFIPPKESLNQNNWKESSINWEDDENSLILLKEQKKNGSIQFKAGIVRLPRSKIDELISHFDLLGVFSYERCPIDGNPYHGNLLFHNGIKSEIRNTICGCLSGMSKLID